LRINGNYCGSTIFYQSFQRADSLGGIGSQIGATPLFSRTQGTQAYSTYPRASDGTLIKVDPDIPRYKAVAWGMNGILLESSAINYFQVSHPTSGSLLWATLTGTPTISWDANCMENVYGKGGAASAIMAVGDSIYYGCSTTAINTGCLSVWLAGQGTVQVEAYNVTTSATIKVSPTVSLTHNVWQLVTLSELDLSTCNSLRIIIRPVTNAARALVGNVMCTAQLFQLQHIVVELAAAAKDIDEFYVMGLKGLTNAATFTAAVIMPPYNLGARNHWLLNNRQNLEMWAEKIDATTGRLFFQKKVSGVKAECTLSILTQMPGAPAILSGGYDANEITLWVNGVRKNSMSYVGIIHTQTNYVQLGNLTQVSAWNAPMMWLRIDNKLLSDTEQAEIFSRYYNQERRVWVNWCEGRDFVIDNMPSAIRVVPDSFQSSFRLIEIRSNETATVEEK